MAYLKAFDDYVSTYDLTNEKIKLKYNHSIRVMNLSEKYAKKLGFNDYDIELAKVIGLLHDIGRFEQLKTYDKYNDRESIDHADYGIEQLFDKGFISKFWNNGDDYELIMFSIKNHNKYRLEEIDDERIMKHAKLIRDTDKLDIIYLIGYLHELNNKYCNDDISKEVLKCVYNHSDIPFEYLNNPNDRIVYNMSYTFDINYYQILEEMKNNLYYYYKYIDNKEKFGEVYKEVIKYIDERIDKRC